MSREQRNRDLRILFSVAVAIALWVFVAFGESAEITVWERNVKVDIAGSSALRDKGLTLVLATAPTVDVRVTGSRQSLYRKEDGDVSARVDVSGIDAPGTYTLPVSGEVSIRGAQATELSPAKLNVTVERLVTVSKPIRVETEGECAENFSVADITWDKVEMTGPESIVKSLSVASEPISVEGAESDVVKRMPLTVTNENGKAVSRADTSISPKMAEITCSVQYEKTVPVAVTLMGTENSAYTFEYEVSPETVMIFGDRTALEDIDEAETLPIDVSGVDSETARTVRLHLPDGVTAAKGTRIEVTLIPVRVTEMPEETATGTPDPENGSH